MLSVENARIGVIGLGYVGLPLAVAFARHLPTTGFDRDRRRIEQLRAGCDSTREVDAAELAAAEQLRLTTEPAALAHCNVFILSVPTPVDRHQRPEMSALRAACALAGERLQPGGLVIVESTVYPGATEEVCVPILEQHSGLTLNQDFFVGYSPERINPGDREHRLETVVKVTAGSTPAAADFVDALYRLVTRAGTHKAASIRVAEAAKVIENTQRDLNIALVNELAVICNRLGIDTLEVLEAAATKWNFLPFRPGLVGGHCVGVDPYYLTYKAQELGHHPEVILAGRRINDTMGRYIAGEVCRLMNRAQLPLCEARILVLGLAFKENCPDLRNSGVVGLIRALEDWGVAVDVYDPWVDPQEAEREYAIRPVDAPAAASYDAVVVAVAHAEFVQLGETGIRAFAKPGGVLYDVKHVLPRAAVDARL